MTLALHPSPRAGSSPRARRSRATASPPTATAPRNYVEIADAYAAEAVADKRGRKFGKWVRLAARRYVDDRKRAGKRGAPFTFDAWHATDACDFIEKLPHVEGKWATPTLVLHPAQVFFVVSLFGFRAPGGGRRFTSALYAIARKNAKSTLAAAILLYCLCCEDEPGAQIVSAATTGQQARIVWNVAKRMVQTTPDLAEAFGLEVFANSIARIEAGGSFKPINAKASTQDGLNPSHAVLDEVHAHKTHDLLNVLQSAAGARATPLWLFTTTEGYESPGPWPELRHFAQQLLQGAFAAEHFLALIYALDDDDRDFDESKWPKANPLIDSNPLLLAEIRKAAIEAKAMPGRHAEFKIKRLNRQAASARGWIDLIRWKACGGRVSLRQLKRLPCYAGLDLSSTRDLTAFRLVWRLDGRYYTWGRRWTPESAVSQRTERGLVPYAAWVQSGAIKATPGDVVDYAIVERDILKICRMFNVREVGYDTWNARDLAKRLADAGIPLVPFIQGPKSYHPAMQELERAYIAGNLLHGADPVLAWCASNTVARTDANLNMAPDKKRSPEKIDDMAALLMALGRLLDGEGAGLPDDYSLLVA